MKCKFVILILALTVLVPRISEAASREFRAVCVHNWLPGLLCSSQADQTIQWSKECNMNTLIVQVRRLGDAYYCSSYEPRANNIEGDKDYDPLGYVIKHAHPEGLQVYAWFNVYRIGTKAGLPPLPNQVGIQHPDWLSKDYNGDKSSEDGEFLDPGVPAVRDYLVKVIADIVKKYDIDGLMLDYIRYPGKNWGYNDIAVSRFNSQYGRMGKPSPDDPLWCNWRRQQVTDTVRAIYNEVHRLKPQVKVTASTIAWGPCPSDFTQTSAYSAVFQDWRLWMKEGILDANVPMDYKDPSTAKGNQWFADWVAGAKKWSYGRQVYCALMLFHDMAGVPEQIQLARSNGADGVVGLAFSQLESKDTIAATLKSTVFKQSALVPKIHWEKRRNKHGQLAAKND